MSHGAPLAPSLTAPRAGLGEMGKRRLGGRPITGDGPRVRKA